MGIDGARVIDRRDGRTNLVGMLARLTRIMMALVTAFVFTGQMEAAAQHCARLAKAAAIVAVAEPDAPPCHESQAAASHMHAAMGHAASHAMSHDSGSPQHSGHAKTPHCECIAALTGWVGLAGATKSGLVEVYAWLTPQQTAFASNEPSPDLRPPRA
jgi:hypothetical protein